MKTDTPFERVVETLRDAGYQLKGHTVGRAWLNDLEHEPVLLMIVTAGSSPGAGSYGMIDLDSVVAYNWRHEDDSGSFALELVNGWLEGLREAGADVHDQELGTMNNGKAYAEISFTATLRQVFPLIRKRWWFMKLEDNIYVQLAQRLVDLDLDDAKEDHPIVERLAWLHNHFLKQQRKDKTNGA
jgi:hypothetical protein